MSGSWEVNELSSCWCKQAKELGSFVLKKILASRGTEPCCASATETETGNKLTSFQVLLNSDSLSGQWETWHQTLYSVTYCVNV